MGQCSGLKLQSSVRSGQAIVGAGAAPGAGAGEAISDGSATLAFLTEGRSKGPKI